MSRSWMAAALLAPALVFLIDAPAAGQIPMPPGARERMEKALEGMEVKPQDPPPAWADPAAEPLFRFVQMSDFHWFWLCIDPDTKTLLESALRFVDERVKPAFVAITGDNAGQESAEAERALKDLLERNLKARWFMIRGDNWPAFYPEVFGSTRYAFESRNELAARRSSRG